MSEVFLAIIFLLVPLVFAYYVSIFFCGKTSKAWALGFAIYFLSLKAISMWIDHFF